MECDRVRESLEVFACEFTSMKFTRSLLATALDQGSARARAKIQQQMENASLKLTEFYI